MKYQGSKARLAKELLGAMDLEGATNWVEPFTGGGNMLAYAKVTGLPRLGGDIDPYVIRALELIRDNPQLIPRDNTEYTKEDYVRARGSDLSNPVDCLAMFSYSFGSKFKGSWASNRRGKDYVREAYRNLLKQSEAIQGVELRHCHYTSLVIPEGSLVYCDPPYANTTMYKSGQFDSAKFWDWVRYLTLDRGLKVYVSEYTAPNDFSCVWSKSVKMNLNHQSNTQTRLEKLFTLLG